MKPILFSSLVLTAALGIAAAPSPAASSTSGSAAGPASASVAGAHAGLASPRLSSEERAALRAVELRDADLSEIKAGFAMSDDDLVLVLGTIAVVVLIALLL